MTRAPEPKVSIILPTYNGASGYLRESIKSCLNQTHRNLELIIVDDCSADDTPEVVESFLDHRIRYIRHEKNLRLPSALNTGFRASTGQFLTWTSDDNEYFPDAIEHMVAYLRDHGECSFVYSDYHALYAESGETELRKLPDQLGLARQNCIGPCFLYTRGVYERVGDYDPKHELVEDYDYWTRVSREFKMIHYPKPLYTYREHSRSLKSTRTHSVVLFDNILKFERHYISTSQFARAVHKFCSAILRSEESLTRSAVIWRQTLLRILDLSFSLGLVFIALSVGSIIREAFGLLKRKAAPTIRGVFEPLRFIHTCYRLKPAREQRNILCLCPSLTIGGAQAVVLSIAGTLGQNGYCFHVLTANRTDNNWHEKFASVFENVIWLGPACGDDWYYRYVSAVIMRLRIDIVLISNSKEGYRCLPRLSSAFPNLKIVDVLHAEKYVGTSDELLWVSPYVHKRVCISHHLRNYMLERYQAFKIAPQHASGLKVIHNGIEVQHVRQNDLRGKFKSRFRIPDETKIISFVGRFSPEKQPFLFVDIAEELIRRTRPDTFKFVMAGDGRQFQQVEKRISSSHLGHAFILTGLIDRVEELYTDTYLLAVVSESEGIPFVVLEAMSAGVPVISTDIGAVSEVVRDGVNGYLIPFSEGTVDRFTSRVLWLLRNEEKYASLSVNARDTITPEYSLDTMARAYEEVFEEMARETTDSGRPRELASESRVREVSLPADRLPVRTARP